jgi:hypothetical protein
VERIWKIIKGAIGKNQYVKVNFIVHDSILCS